MLSILLGFLGYSILNISQATQKIGLMLAREKKVQGRLLWTVATLGTLASSFVVLAAVSLGNASLVGAMAGAGLASLAIFSRLVMKEHVSKIQAAGILLIILAAGLIGLFSNDSQASQVRLDLLFVMLGGVTGFSLLLWFCVRAKTVLSGLVIGGFSGALGGFVPLFQKVATSEIGKSTSLLPVSGDSGFLSALLAMFANPFALSWILLSLVSMLVLQFSYKKADAIRIIPFFSASCIVIPVIGGVLCLAEELHILQWLGVALILGGLCLLTVKSRKVQSQG